MKRILLQLTLLFLPISLLAQQDDLYFGVIPNQLEVNLNETFVVDFFVISTQKSISLQHLKFENPFPPSFQKERIDNSIKTSFVQGKWNNKKIWSCHMTSTKPGTYNVIAELQHGNNTLKSRPLHITVRDEQNPIDRTKEDGLFLRSILDSNRVYVGSKVSHILELGTMHSIQNLYKIEPGLPDGVAVESNHQFRSPTSTRNVDDEVFSVKRISQQFLYPLTPGKMTIPTSNVVVAIDTTDTENEQSFFKKAGLRKTIHSKPVEFEVLPLPDGYSTRNCALDLKKMTWEVDSSSMWQDGVFTFNLTMESEAHPYFMLPPELPVGTVAKSVRLLESMGNQRTFQYTLRFYENVDFTVNPVVRSWNTTTSEWEEIKFEKPLVISADEVMTVDETQNPDWLFWEEIAIVLVDCSSSMLTQDYDTSRWHFVIKNLEQTLQQKPDNQRIAVIGFAGETTVLHSFQEEQNNYPASVESFQFGMLEDGTAIGDAFMLALGINHVDAQKKRIILITDGDDNASTFHPKFVAGMAADASLPIYCIGLGKEGHANTPVSKGRDGSFIYDFRVTKAPPAIIHEIADITGGKSFEVLSDDDFMEAWNEAMNGQSNEPSRSINLPPILRDIYLSNALFTQKIFD